MSGWMRVQISRDFQREGHNEKQWFRQMSSTTELKLWERQVLDTGAPQA